MHIAANLIIHQCNEGLAVKHVPQSDPEKQSILIDALRPKGGYMERVGHKCVGQDRYRSIQLSR